MTIDDLERAAIAVLAEELPKWQQKMGPGLDCGMGALVQLVQQVDKAAAKADPGDTNVTAQREAALMTLNAYLASGPEITPFLREQKKIRVRKLGPAQAKYVLAYDVKTMELFAGEFPAWYAEVGLGGFLRSVHAICKVTADIYDEIEATNKGGIKNLFFGLSFELRARLGKVNPALLEALKYLPERQAA